MLIKNKDGRNTRTRQIYIIPAQSGYYTISLVEGDDGRPDELHVMAILAWEIEHIRCNSGGVEFDEGPFVYPITLEGKVDTIGLIRTPDGQTIEPCNRYFDVGDDAAIIKHLKEQQTANWKPALKEV